MTMIELTRLNKHPLSVNSDLIKFVEGSADTILTLVTGEKIVVLESPAEVCRRVLEFRRSLLRGLPPIWDGSHVDFLLSQQPAKHEL
jgi:flagellar protein FlbD